MMICKKTIKSIIVILLFWFSSYFQLIPIYLLHLNAHNFSESMEVILSLFSNIILVFIYFFLYRKDLIEDFKKFKTNTIEKLDIAFRYWLIGLVLMMIFNYLIIFFFKGNGANNEIAIQSMIKAFPLLMLIDGGFIGPFNEEIVFRKSFRDIISNKWVLALVSFLLFGGAHVIFSAKVLSDYLYIIPYGTLGACLALAYYETDTIFTSIFTHMVHNIILILLSIVTLGL